MKKIIIKYLYDSSWEYGERWREIPSKKARVTGVYFEEDGEIYVQIEEKSLFGLIKELRMISEDDFRFYEVEEFNCNPIKIGFVDKNENDLYLGQTVQTFDKKGRRWIGTIVRVDQYRVSKGNNPQFAFKSNIETWINNQEYASTLEIIED